MKASSIIQLILNLDPMMQSVVAAVWGLSYWVRTSLRQRKRTAAFNLWINPKFEQGDG